MTVQADVATRGDSGTASRVWHATFTVVMGVCFAIQIVLLFAGGPDANSGAVEPGLGTRLVRFFSYFTIQSNIVILVAAATLMVRPFRDGRVWRVLRLDSMIGIVITGLVFDLVLARQVHLDGLAWWLTVAFHYFSPWWALLGWLLFGPRPRISCATVALAFGWPLLWVAYTFVHGAVTGWYPYPFLDAGKLGVGDALRNTSVVVLLALVLALVFKALDRLPTVRR